jgi:hypothetical protein
MYRPRPDSLPGSGRIVPTGWDGAGVAGRSQTSTRSLVPVHSALTRTRFWGPGRRGGCCCSAVR